MEKNEAARLARRPLHAVHCMQSKTLMNRKRDLILDGQTCDWRVRY